MVHRKDVQQVELDEDDDLVPTSPAAARPLRLPFRRRWLVVGAAVAAAGIGAGEWVATAREDAAVARLAEVPGVLTPVDETLTVGRRLPQNLLAEPAPVPGGTLRRGSDGSLAYHWADPAGAGWTAPLLPADARLAGAAHVASASTCDTDVVPGVDPLSATRVVCLVADGGTAFTESGAIETVPTTAVGVVVLSATDGSVETRWPVPAGETLALMPGGLVAVGALTGHLAVVTGYDMLTGTERWTYEQDATPTAGRQGVGAPDVSLLRSGDLMALVPPDRAAVLLSTDGRWVRGGLVDADATAWDLRRDERTRRLVVTTDGAFRSNRATFVAPDGDPENDVVLDGHPLAVQVDDGSLSGVALTADVRSVHGAEVGPGRTRWTVGVETPGLALVLRGRVLVTGAHGVTAVDGRSGHVLWRSADEDGLAPESLMADPRHVLVAYERTGADAHAAVVAYDPSSGQEVFRAPYPDGVQDLQPWGRHLTGSDDEGGRVQLD
ncbi:PQQ-binding-like beta-propeller repeat protein [Cellulomonas sp.]|uniref:outer membrane protein assembly factor BamB family protein n=1 Tax=Cellulomonas sp. TaxID=40001 RepID=UPI001B1C0EB0|nr:PQQ-binding-like beta-propeller repeat protein [Cellulomonas sp.]MBO9553088.1 hypothetical protein [Cellulomonas sp.]